MTTLELHSSSKTIKPSLRSINLFASKFTKLFGQKTIREGYPLLETVYLIELISMDGVKRVFKICQCILFALGVKLPAMAETHKMSLFGFAGGDVAHFVNYTTHSQHLDHPASFNECSNKN